MCSKSSSRVRRGFTLVELLVAIALILLLIAMLLPAARRSREGARQIACLSHLRQIAQATLMYCQDNDDTFPGITGVDPGTTSGPAPLPSEWIYWQSIYLPPFNDPLKSPVMRYLGTDLTVLRCPSDDVDGHPAPISGIQGHPQYGAYRFSYVMNVWTATWPQDWDTNTNRKQYGMWPAAHLREVNNPSQKIFFLEEDPRFIDDGSYFITLFMAAGSGGNPYAEPPSFVHDTYRNMADPTQSSDGWRSRTNVVFCDGHGEFVSGLFIAPGILHPGVNLPADRLHFDPHL